MNVLEPKGACSDADCRSITGKSAGFSEREQRSDAKRYDCLSKHGVYGELSGCWKTRETL